MSNKYNDDSYVLKLGIMPYVLGSNHFTGSFGNRQEVESSAHCGGIQQAYWGMRGRCWIYFQLPASDEMDIIPSTIDSSDPSILATISSGMEIRKMYETNKKLISYDPVVDRAWKMEEFLLLCQ